MGWFKKITKSISKVVKKVTNPVRKAVGSVVGSQPTGAQTVETVQEAPAAAQPVDLATQTDVQNTDDSTTESGKRRQAANGKRSLSIARSGGTGINI